MSPLRTFSMPVRSPGSSDSARSRSVTAAGLPPIRHIGAGRNSPQAHASDPAGQPGTCSGACGAAPPLALSQIVGTFGDRGGASPVETGRRSEVAIGAQSLAARSIAPRSERPVPLRSSTIRALICGASDPPVRSGGQQAAQGAGEPRIMDSSSRTAAPSARVEAPPPGLASLPWRGDTHLLADVPSIWSTVRF